MTEGQPGKSGPLEIVAPNWMGKSAHSIPEHWPASVARAADMTS